jgi:hypothetical protein
MFIVAVFIIHGQQPKPESEHKHVATQAFVGFPLEVSVARAFQWNFTFGSVEIPATACANCLQ